MRFIGVFNRDGGTFRTMDLEAFGARAVEVFAAHRHELEVRIVSGAELIEALERAAAEGEALLAAGGDGTISAAAAIAYRKSVPLAVLPAGTMNLFVRSLALPLDLDAALEAVAGGEIRAIDIATANGRPFVHQFSVGIHPKLVRLREALSYHSRLGKIIASTRAALAAILKPPNFRVDIMTPRGKERRATAGISISNNPLMEGHAPFAEGLEGGVLGFYLAKPMSPWTLARLCLGVIGGHWKAAPEVVEREAREVSISFPRWKSSALAVIDGELLKLPRRIELKIHPGALRVVLPAADPAERAPPEHAGALAPA